CTLSTPSRMVLPEISFSASSQIVEVYDFMEVTASVSQPHPRNPFTDVVFSGWFELVDGSKRWRGEGVCDSEGGGRFRIRFTPPVAGGYRYFVEYWQGNSRRNYTGAFRATQGPRRGPIRVDSKYPWHFVWEGTGEHYFFNGTTAYWLMGWSDEKVIETSI